MDSSQHNSRPLGVTFGMLRGRKGAVPIQSLPGTSPLQSKSVPGSIEKDWMDSHPCQTGGQMCTDKDWLSCQHAWYMKCDWWNRNRSNDCAFVSTTLLGLIAPKGLDTNGTLGPMLGVHPLQLTDHNTGTSLLLSTSVWVLLIPPIERRETRPTA